MSSLAIATVAAPTVRSDTRLDEVVANVASTALRRVVVIDAQRYVLGIITDADLIERLSGGAHAGLLRIFRSHIPFWSSEETIRDALAELHARQAQDVMRRDVVVVAANASIVEAMQRMMEQHINTKITKAF